MNHILLFYHKPTHSTVESSPPEIEVYFVGIHGVFLQKKNTCPYRQLYVTFKGDILWKQHFSWDLRCCFGSLVLPHAYKQIFHSWILWCVPESSNARLPSRKSKISQLSCGISRRHSPFLSSSFKNLRVDREQWWRSQQNVCAREEIFHFSSFSTSF